MSLRQHRRPPSNEFGLFVAAMSAVCLKQTGSHSVTAKRQSLSGSKRQSSVAAKWQPSRQPSSDSQAVWWAATEACCRSRIAALIASAARNSAILQSIYSQSTANVQSTYSQYRVSIQSIYSQYTVNVQSTYSQCAVNIQSMCSQYTVNIQSIQGQYTVNVRSTYRPILRQYMVNETLYTHCAQYPLDVHCTSAD